MVEFETDYTLLSFHVGEYQFCVPAGEVLEVTYAPKITKIIATPDYVVGTFLNRGVLASAINLRRKFSLAGEDNSQSCFIISKLNDGNTIAIEVDGVGDVIDGGCLEWQVLPSGTVSRIFDKCTCYNDQVVFHSSLNVLFNYDGELRTAEMNYVRKLFGNEINSSPKKSNELQNNIEQLEDSQRNEQVLEVVSDSTQTQQEKENSANNANKSFDLIPCDKFEKDVVLNIDVKLCASEKQQSIHDEDKEEVSEGGNISSILANNLITIPTVIPLDEIKNDAKISTTFEILPYEKFLKIVNSGVEFKSHQIDKMQSTFDNINLEANQYLANREIVSLIDIDQGTEVKDCEIDNEFVLCSEYFSRINDSLDIKLYNSTETLPLVIEVKNKIEVKDKIEGEMKLLQKPEKKTLILQNVFGLLNNETCTSSSETAEQHSGSDGIPLIQRKMLTFYRNWAKVSMVDQYPLHARYDKNFYKLLHKNTEKNILLPLLVENDDISNIKIQDTSIKLDEKYTEQLEVGEVDANNLVCSDLQDVETTNEINETNESIEFDKSCDPVKQLDFRRHRMIAAGLSITTFAIVASMGISTYNNDAVPGSNKKSVIDGNLVLKAPINQNESRQTELLISQEVQVPVKQEITRGEQDKAIKTETTVALVSSESIIEDEKSEQFNTIVHQTTLTELPHSTDVHNVEEGDTLWFVAKYYLNNPFLYPKLADYNGIPNPNLIYPGEKIRIMSMDDNRK